MNEILLRIVCVVLCVMIISSARTQQMQGIEPGKLYVKFKSGAHQALKGARLNTQSGRIQTGIGAIDVLNEKFHVTALHPVFPSNPAKEELHRKHGLHLWYELTTDVSANIEMAVQEFRTNSEVEFAEPALIKKVIDPGRKVLFDRESQTDVTTFAVNDPLFSFQWHYENDGTNGGVADADINLLKAWKISTGKPNVIVAVHDLGIDVNHRDLATNIWINTIERDGIAGVDDDYNGYVDDLHGYDFVNDSPVIPGEDHGTHVAGTVAAVNNNGIGVAGIAGGDGVSPGVKLMSLKIIGGAADIAASYVYAADNGAVISQNSWGYTTVGAYEQVVLDAIDYFAEEAGNYPNSPMKGGLVIFAAGNSSEDKKFYPGYYDGVLSVSSLGRDNKVAFYSNFGEWVDIAAPGGDQGDFGDFPENGVLSTLPRNQYGFFQGTSMACPHVAGIAALVVSKYGGQSYRASDLRTALVTGTHDIDEVNPDYAGKLGTGYIDAALALDQNFGLAPTTVNDLTAIAHQSSIDLQWSIVDDDDDGKPLRYEIRYGTDPIAVEQATDAASIHYLEAKNISGTSASFIIPDLRYDLEYFAAVFAIDRWGNRSLPSNLVRATTTPGPVVSLSKEIIQIEIDVEKGLVATDEFNVENRGIGSLSWAGVVRQRSFFLESLIARQHDGGNSIHTNARGKLGQRKSTSVLFTQQIKSYGDDFKGRDMLYHAVNPEYMIGDEDTSIPNSAATRFVVDYEDGFNLTDLWFMVRNNVDKGDAPLVIEVYQGEVLHHKNLVYTTRYSGYSDFDELTPIHLDHQLFFPKGETFWIVLHAPPGKLYPLGANIELEPEYSNNCFYSNDLGQTWNSLEKVTGNGTLVWFAIASSLSPPLHEYVKLAPASGTLLPNADETVAISVNAEKLINGEYTADVVVQNNDEVNPLTKVELNIKVFGHKPSLHSELVVDYGQGFIGTTTDSTVTVFNEGFGNFAIEQATVDNEAFEIVAYPEKIEARGQAGIYIRFKPQVIGNANGKVTLVSSSGDHYFFNVAGSGIEPSSISVSPESISISDVVLGDTRSGSFTVTNAGTYPLKFFLPQFSSGDGVNVEGKNLNRFGYTFQTSASSSEVVYQWEDITADGVEISEFFRNPLLNTFFPVSLGFNFPIFAHVTDTLMITRFGVLTLDDNKPFSGNPIYAGKEENPDGLISGLNLKLDFQAGGKLYYKILPGKLIVQYNDVAVYDSRGATVTFQFIITADGNTVVNYKKITSVSEVELRSLEVAVEDPEKKYGYNISNYDMPLNAVDEFTVKIYSPGRPFIKTVSASSGLLLQGEASNINFSLATEDLTEGNFTQKLPLFSDDPLQPLSFLTVSVNVNSGGLAEIILDESTVDLGELFVGEVAQTEIKISNQGTKSVYLSSIESLSGHFELSTLELPLEIRSQSSISVTARIRGVDVGAVSDQVEVRFDNGVTRRKSLFVEVISAPQLVVERDPIFYELEAGETVIHELQVANNGASELEIVPAGNSWVYVVEDVTASGANQFVNKTYGLHLSTEGAEVLYQWNDIASNDTRLESLLNQDFVTVRTQETEVELPFPFEFYGNSYSKMYVNSHGLITFTPNQLIDNASPGVIPVEGQPNNFIAPFWHLGGYDFNSEDVGVYYKAYPDYVVVQYSRIIAQFTGHGEIFDVQLILFKNGNIKFQYKTGDFIISNTGLIGVEDETGLIGTQVLSLSQFEGNLAILLTPLNRMAIASGESKTLKLKFDASYLLGGEYSSNFLIRSNDPSAELATIPVNLKVNGQALIEVADRIDFGDVMVEEGGEHVLAKEFVLKNIGTSALEISQIGFLNPDVVSLWSFEIDYWEPVSSEMFLEPLSEKLLKVEVIVPGEQHEFNDMWSFNANIAEESMKIPIAAQVLFPPSIEINELNFNFVANDDTYREEAYFDITNTGRSDLKYALDVKYLRPNSNLGLIKAQSSTPQQTSLGRFPLKSGQMRVQDISIQSNRVLHYGSDELPSETIGFGVSAAFVSATRFRADELGFNLTDVVTFYKAGGLIQDHPFVVEVYAGDAIENSTLLISQEFHRTDLTSDFEGVLNFEFDQPQFLYPNETFFVVIHYPFGADYPQGVIYLDEGLENTFLYHVGDNVWEDIQTVPGFRKAAWYVSAIEESYRDGGWLSLTASSAGVVSVGASEQIPFNINGQNLSQVDAYANIIVTSNDPTRPAENILVHLHMNQAPTFDVNVSQLNAKENELFALVIPVLNDDSEEIFYSVDEVVEELSLEPVESGVRITYMPGFQSAGEYTIQLIARDSKGRQSTMPLMLSVADKNRAPLVVSGEDLHFSLSAEFVELAVGTLVKDEDVDNTLQVVVSSQDENVVEAFASEDKILLKFNGPGETFLDLTAADNHGAQINHSVKVIVSGVTAVDNPLLKYVKVYPNPVSEILYVDFENSTTPGNITVRNSTGHNILSAQANVNGHTEIDLSHLSAGIYLIEVKVKAKVHTAKIMKR